MYYNHITISLYLIIHLCNTYSADRSLRFVRSQRINKQINKFEEKSVKLRTWKARGQIVVPFVTIVWTFSHVDWKVERYRERRKMLWNFGFGVSTVIGESRFEAGSPRRGGINFYKGIKRLLVRRGEERGRNLSICHERGN